MKKIGILTYFWAHNPGTFLQAYSTVNTVNKFFPYACVEIINCKIRKVKFKPSRYDFRISKLIEHLHNFNIYERFIKTKLPKSKPSFVSLDYSKLTEYILQKNYDLILVGADTVLEILPLHLKSDQIPIYWLPAKIKTTKVLCAASAGALSYENLHKRYQRALSDSINSFYLIGVRDDNTLNLVKKLLVNKNIPVEMIPDPTFSMEIAHTPVELFLSKKGIKFRRPTIAINLPESLPICQKLINYYQKRGFTVILLGYGGYASKRRECRFPKMSPFEWAGLHRYFSLEITDRFHGCIFALKNSIPVVAIDHQKHKYTATGLSKTYSLLKLYNMHETNHINLSNFSRFDEIVKITDNALKNFDSSFVAKRTKELAERYINFVKNVKSLVEQN